MTLSQAEFTYVSQLVRREASIVLAAGKEYLVEARLIPVARAVGAANANEFLADPQRRPNPANQRKCTGCGELIADKTLKECPSCEAPLSIWGKDVEGK